MNNRPSTPGASSPAGSSPASTGRHRFVVRLPLLSRVVVSLLLLAPVTLLVNAIQDPTAFTETGASVTFQWVVTVAMSIGAVLVFVAMWRSRIVVDEERVTRYRGLRRPVTITREGAWSLALTQNESQVHDALRNPAPGITVVGDGGRTIVSHQRADEARALLPHLLGWTATRPDLMADQYTRQFFAAYERSLLGTQANPYT